MATIRSISSTTHEGKEGFVIEWEMIGFGKREARFRAVVSTAFRFPTTITEAEVVGVREFDSNDFNVQVFVPTEGILSAGVTNPIDWLRETFGEERLKL